MKGILGLLCVMVVVATLAACGSSESDSGVLGLAIHRPEHAATFSASPLPIELGWTTGDILPDPHATVLVKDSGGKTVARVATDGQGVFRLSLPPGDYLVVGKGLPAFFGTQTPVHTGEFSRIMVRTKAP